MRKHILYLASGSGRRFGGNKLLHKIHEKPLFCHGLEVLWAVADSLRDCAVTVVSRYEEIRTTAQQLGFSAVDAPESCQGISHTIRAGIQALDASPEDYLLFVVADQPWLRAESIHRLLDLADTGAVCGSLCYEGRPGNPTLFSARLIPELMALEGDTGGRAVLRRHGCIFVEASSPEELRDIDTRE